MNIHSIRNSKNWQYSGEAQIEAMLASGATIAADWMRARRKDYKSVLNALKRRGWILDHDKETDTYQLIERANQCGDCGSDFGHKQTCSKSSMKHLFKTVWQK